MTDSDIKTVKKGDVLIDGGGREWIATVDAQRREGVIEGYYVIVRRNSMVIHLKHHSAMDWRIKPRRRNLPT